MSPKTIAPVGHACWHAVCTNPSGMYLRSEILVSTLAALMRWMQYEHFSITPRDRTVTCGFFWRFCTSRFLARSRGGIQFWFSGIGALPARGAPTWPQPPLYCLVP